MPQSSDDIKPANNFSLLLQGPPKSGKTVLALHFPKPYVLDCDQNLAGPKRYFVDNKLPIHFDFDTVAVKDGKKVPLELQWARAVRLLAEAGNAAQDGKYQTIIVDSGTTLNEMVQHHIMSTEKPGEYSTGKMKMTLPMFGDFKQIMTKFLTTYTKLPNVNFVFLCHEEPEKDEMDSVLYYRPSFVGSLKHTIGAFFTDVWRTEIVRKPNDVFEYQVRTMPTAKVSLGNSLGLPASFVFDWKVVADKLRLS